MQFKDIVGFEEEKDHLITSVRANKIAHAQLFAGKEGGAHLALALAFATYLNCTNQQESDSCGSCDSCVKNAKLIHPDLHFAFPVSSTKKVKGPKITSAEFMNEWRTFATSQPFGVLTDWNQVYGGEDKSPIIPVEESRKIIKDLSLKTFEGNFKILIMWLPELMNGSAANALLKILEEPPENTVFILVSNTQEQLISTILSRTQIFHIRPFRDEEIRSILGSKVSSDKLDEIIQLSDGNINYAMSLADQNDGGAQDFFARWMRSCYAYDFESLMKHTEEFQKFSKMGQRSFLLFALSLMRETLVAQLEGAEILNRSAGSTQGFVKDFKSVMNWEKIESISGLINQASYHLERNANPRILFMDLSLQIAQEIRK